MGSTNTYRYVNATNVYNKGKSDSGVAIKNFSGSFNPGDIFIYMLVHGYDTVIPTCRINTSLVETLVDWDSVIGNCHVRIYVFKALRSGDTSDAAYNIIATGSCMHLVHKG